MNRQITRVALVALLLLISLIVATTYWQTWAVAGLEDKQDNAIQRVAQFTVRRGLVYAADGRTLLAANRARKVEGRTLYFRRYPSADLAADVVGYSTASRSRAGLERSLNDYLTASNSNLNTVLRKTWDKLKGATVTGNNVILTLNAKAQRVALDALAGRCGAAVALDPKTGAVLVMATRPTYDPNLIETNFGRIERTAAPCSPAAPLLNRATNGLYPPGSTFKVVTTAAALDSGKFTIDSRFKDPGYCIEYGKKVSNYADQSGPEVFGSVSFTQALEHSINAVYCEIGKALGPKLLVDYTRRFGFYKRPPIETPADERAPSGLYKNHKPFLPKRDSDVDPGRFAFGQERLLTSPLQMAMVAATIANKGDLMEPYLVKRITLAGGDETVTKTKPRVLEHAVKPEVAQTVATMMVAVVESGTGTHAQIPGVAVAGKTGTAETGVAGRNTTWFIAFAPAEDPQVAVAVALENQRGTGGTTAAPIAKTIMQALLPSKSNP